MESESDDSSTDGSEDESEDEGDQDGTGVPTQASNSASQINDGLMTPSGKTDIFMYHYKIMHCRNNVRSTASRY